MSHAFRVLRVVFESRERLDREVAANLAHGGLFLPGQLDLLYGEPVLVFLDLAFAGTMVEVEGRVVQTIPVEFEAGGGRCGVALELSEAAPEIRQRLEEAIGDRLEVEHEKMATVPASPSGRSPMYVLEFEFRECLSSRDGRAI